MLRHPFHCHCALLLCSEVLLSTWDNTVSQTRAQQPNQFFANAFTTGDGGPYVINQLTLLVQGFLYYNIDLYNTDSGGLPTTAVPGAQQFWGTLRNPPGPHLPMTLRVDGGWRLESR